MEVLVMRALYYYCREISIGGIVEAIIGGEERGRGGR